MANQLPSIKQSVATATAREQELRNRETELAQALQAEEARWTDLTSRLEQAIKR
jgi:hypothetical protein